MKTFIMYRPEVPDETHNSDQKNAPDEPQFEGVVFDTGVTVIHWLTAVKSTSVFSSFEEMMRIHGHPEYGSRIVWWSVEDGRP